MAWYGMGRPSWKYYNGYCTNCKTKKETRFPLTFFWHGCEHITCDDCRLEIVNKIEFEPLYSDLYPLYCFQCYMIEKHLKKPQSCIAHTYK